VSAHFRRVVVCLDVDVGRVKKGIQFQSLRDVGDPVELALRYEAEGADEITFLDVSASHESRATMFDVVRRTADALFIPLTVGGGIRSSDDVARALEAGADKVGINSAAIGDPTILEQASRRFGAQCIVLSVDARRDADHAFTSGYRVVTHGGRRPTDRDAVAWCKEGCERGAGEVLVTSIDRDGKREGYDVELLGAVTRVVTVPVVASGGAGSAAHLTDAFRSGADAALVAGILHDGTTHVSALKQALLGDGIAIRSTH
jgi:imidazole glycerol-phosphate synthase subunit HisF